MGVLVKFTKFTERPGKDGFKSLQMKTLDERYMRRYMHIHRTKSIYKNQ